MQQESSKESEREIQGAGQPSAPSQQAPPENVSSGSNINNSQEASGRSNINLSEENSGGRSLNTSNSENSRGSSGALNTSGNAGTSTDSVSSGNLLFLIFEETPESSAPPQAELSVIASRIKLQVVAQIFPLERQTSGNEGESPETMLISPHIHYHQMPFHPRRIK